MLLTAAAELLEIRFAATSGPAARVREQIEAVGPHLRYLPPYPPNLNPVEQALA